MRGSGLLAALLFLAACGGSPEVGGPSPTSTPGPTKSVPALKLAVLAAVGGRIDYCDPDEYPVPHGAPAENARARFDLIKRDRVAFAAILEYEGLSPDQEYTEDELIAISDDYKQMQAIELQPSGDGYRFSVLVPKTGTQSGNETVGGSVDLSGMVEVEDRTPGKPLNCPICLAEGTRIATPIGDVAVEDLAVGMPIWTVDLKGRRVPGVVTRSGRTLAPRGHRVVRILLADGRSVVASPAHPTADGRLIGDLRPGDRLDGSEVLSAVLVAYRGAMTFDVLASGPTGAYFAGGVLLWSTLAIERSLAPSA